MIFRDFNWDHYERIYYSSKLINHKHGSLNISLKLIKFKDLLKLFKIYINLFFKLFYYLKL